MSVLILFCSVQVKIKKKKKRFKQFLSKRSNFLIFKISYFLRNAKCVFVSILIVKVGQRFSFIYFENFKFDKYCQI